MTTSPSPTAHVDRLAGRIGMSGDAVAILMILAGILVIVFPDLLAITVGILLIVLGAWWLFQRSQERRASQPTTAPVSPPYSPPPP